MSNENIYNELDETGLPAIKHPESVRGLLRNKVGIITGASRGIGAASASVFVNAGARVVLAARNLKSLETLADKINSSFLGAAFPFQIDVTDSESVKNLVEKTLEIYGHLDIAFNNAGDGHMPSPLAALSESDFERAIKTNVTGTFLCMKHEIPAMLKSGGGSIVNMSSTAGIEGVKGLAGYTAGKHAVIGLTRSAAIDYGRENIRVNAVAPGPILTERYVGTKVPEQIGFAVPMGRIGNREEVANVVTWLCSDLSSFVTGTTISVDGGRMAGVWFPSSPVTAQVNSVTKLANGI